MTHKTESKFYPVLLGLRSSYKKDIKMSAAEIVYGTIVKLPGEYFVTEDLIDCSQTFVEKLKEKMRQISQPQLLKLYQT